MEVSDFQNFLNEYCIALCEAHSIETTKAFKYMEFSSNKLIAFGECLCLFCNKPTRCCISKKHHRALCIECWRTWSLAPNI